MTVAKRYSSPNHKHHGECHVCGKRCSLSFEHIPPRSTGNKTRARAYSGADIIQAHGIKPIESLDNFRYDQMQQGSGVYSLCASCNSYFGANYVKVFAEALNETRGLFLNTLPHGEKVNSTILQTDKMHALAFFKHVISSFCATTQPGTMLDCREFLLDRESNALPDHLKLLMFAIPDTNSRGLRTGWTTPFMKDDSFYQVAHLVTPPFGFSLYDLKNANTSIPFAGCDITSFSTCRWNEYPQIHLELHHAEGNMLFPRMIIDPSQIS